MTAKDFSARRQTLGLSQRGFASLTGYAPSSVAKWETSGRVPRYAERSLEMLETLRTVRDNARKHFSDEMA